MTEEAGPEWRIAVEPVCVGSGMCAGTAPEYFRMKGGRSQARRPAVAPDAKLLDIAESCPVEAIRVRDRDGVLLAPEDLRDS